MFYLIQFLWTTRHQYIFTPKSHQEAHSPTVPDKQLHALRVQLWCSAPCIKWHHQASSRQQTGNFKAKLVLEVSGDLQHHPWTHQTRDKIDRFQEKTQDLGGTQHKYLRDTITTSAGTKVNNSYVLVHFMLKLIN